MTCNAPQSNCIGLGLQVRITRARLIIKECNYKMRPQLCRANSTETHKLTRMNRTYIFKSPESFSLNNSCTFQLRMGMLNPFNWLKLGKRVNSKVCCTKWACIFKLKEQLNRIKFLVSSIHCT